MKTKIFLQKGLDDPNQIESLQKIAIYVDAISEASRRQRSDIEKKFN
jgi:hypothetical protein